MKGGTMKYEKFTQNPFTYVYNFLCAQTALNIIFGVMIVVLILGMINTKDKLEVITNGTDIALSSNISIVEGSYKMSKDIIDLRVQTNILEAMQQRIIVNSPELYKQYDQMFSEVEVEVLEGLKREVDKTEKEMEKLDKGLKKLIPENKGLRLDLDRSGEYAI
jgi:hypothetical protein